MKKKRINKRAITVGILTAITVSLFASVIVAYGMDRDMKAERAAFLDKVASPCVAFDDVNNDIQRSIPIVKTVDTVDILTVAVGEVPVEEYCAQTYVDYTEIMSKQYNLGTGVYGFSSRDAYVLACIVSAEAGDQGYDCQLAVANVVIHRALGLGGYPGSIEDAVYQPYQFEPAYTTMQTFLAYGPQEDAIRASQDALNGIDNVPGYKHFCYYTIMDGYQDRDGGVLIGSEWFYY